MIGSGVRIWFVKSLESCKLRNDSVPEESPGTEFGGIMEPAVVVD